jgi:hypothetical protein
MKGQHQMLGTLYRVVAALALCGALATGAQAASAKLGMLSCELTGVENDIVYTDEKFLCTFNPSSGANETYDGTIQEIGVNLSIKKSQKLVWEVFAPSSDNKTGALAGDYVGASADATLGAGLGAKVLVGGGAKSFTLQPISLAGSTGVGVDVGIQRFSLSYRP